MWFTWRRIWRLILQMIKKYCNECLSELMRMGAALSRMRNWSKEPGKTQIPEPFACDGHRWIRLAATFWHDWQHGRRRNWEFWIYRCFEPLGAWQQDGAPFRQVQRSAVIADAGRTVWDSSRTIWDVIVSAGPLVLLQTKPFESPCHILSCCRDLARTMLHVVICTVVFR